MQTPKQALAELEKGKVEPIYYLFGDEPFKINEFIDKVLQIAFGPRKSATDLAFCIDRLDGAVATGSDVLEAIQSIGLFGASGTDSKRVVIVRQAHQLKDVDGLHQTLVDAKGGSPWGQSILLLAGESLDGRRKFHQWIKKQGLAFEFKPARDAELAQWVQYLSKKLGARISPEASQMLAVSCDGSLYRLAQEIDKAWLFSGAGDTQIEAEHVAAVSSTQLTHEMVELVRAILEGKRARGLLLAEKLIRGPEDAIGLVGFLTWAIKNPSRGIVQAAMPPVRSRKLVHALLELDRRLKGSGLDPNALVEQFVIENSQPMRA